MKKLLVIILFSQFYITNTFSQCAQCPVPPAAGLVGYWQFNNNYLDASVNGNTGDPDTGKGSTPTFVVDRYNNANSALYFGGYYDQDWVRIKNSASLKFTKTMSISIWFKQCDMSGMNEFQQYSPNGYSVLFAKGGDGIGTNPGFYSYTHYDLTNNFKILYTSTNTDIGIYNTFPCFDPCEWIHYVVVIDGNNNQVKEYFDGKLTIVNTFTNINFNDANNQDLLFGRMDGPAVFYPFKGTIDDVLLYNRVLTDNEISDLYFNFQNPLLDLPNLTFNVSITKACLSNTGQIQINAKGGVPPYEYSLDNTVWQSSSTFSNLAAGNYHVYCRTKCSTHDSIVNLPLNAILPVSVSTTADANNVCAGKLVTFTATPTNGGSNPSYQWMRNGIPVPGATNSIYTYAPANGDAITCVLTSNVACPTAGSNPATSAAINMTVFNNNPVSVTIAGTNPVCPGTSVKFTATPTNGGTTPTYQWYLNGNPVGGETNSTYTMTPNNGDAIKCVLTSNVACPSGNPATSSTIIMSVNSNLPVTVSIGADANPVCTGTTVTFTANPTNGGAAPSYQWQVNGVNGTGISTNKTYAYKPNDTEVITCIITSNAACSTGNPATSNKITMKVNTILSVSISITANPNPVCTGNPVTFTVTPTNGGTNPSYQWNLNVGIIPGATNSTYTYTPTNGDRINCTLKSDEICATGNPATSPVITMTVNPKLPVSVIITASANPVCTGSSVTFTAAPTNGGTAPSYQWRLGGADIPGATNSTYTYPPANNDNITCFITSNYFCTTGNTATSNSIIITISPDKPVSISITASANPICPGGSVKFTAIPTNGGGVPSYQWKIGGINIPGATNSTYTYNPGNGDVITCVLNSNATPCATGSPATSNAITITYTVSSPVSISISASANPICVGTSVTFTATPNNGGITPSYQWKRNNTIIPGATNSIYTYNPLNGDIITCVLTSDLGCSTGNPATSNQITMVVNPILPVSISITVSANPVCTGTQVTFTANSVNGGTVPSYQWKIKGVNIPGATNSTYTYTPANGDEITCELTSNAICPSVNPATSNKIIMTISSILPVSVSITASANPICPGSSVTFTATALNGGSTPTYKWMKNGVVIVGATKSTYTYNPLNGEDITCEVTSNSSCVTGNPALSNKITMTVNSNLVVKVVIVASVNPVCAGSPVTFTATPSNGGSAPSYQWKLGLNNIPNATNSTYTYIPINGDLITCVLTSSEICPTGNPAASNIITITAMGNQPVSLTISVNANTVCDGSSVTFTAKPTNPGGAPSYQWKNHGVIIPGATNITYIYTPIDGDDITCELISSVACPSISPAISNSIQMKVNLNLPVSVTITSSATTVCAGTNVTFTANPTNGGNAPSYLWKVNGVSKTANTTVSTFSWVPLNNDVITCVITSNAAPCATGNPATSNTITITVNANLPVSVTITADANPVCAGTSVTFTANPTNGGAVPSYQWKIGGANINGATKSTYTYIPINGAILTCVVTSDLTCTSGNPATSPAITMTVNPLLTVGITITANQNPVCDGTAVTFTAIPTNGGAKPSYQWQNNGVNIPPNETNSTYTYTPALNNTDKITCIVTSNVAPCPDGNPATSSSITITVNPNLPVSVSIVSDANGVCPGTTVNFIATPTNGGAAPSYQWKVNGVNNGGNTTVSTFSYKPADKDVVTCVITSNATPCATGNPATSNSVNMTVTVPLVIDISIAAGANPVCAGTPVTFTVTPTNEGNAPSYQWQVNGGNGTGTTTNSTYTYVPVNGDKITCILTSSISCNTGNPKTSNTITMTVNPLLTVGITITANQNPVCDGTAVTFTATPTNGGAKPSYQWQNNGVNIPPNETNSTYTYTPALNNTDKITCIVTSNIAPCPDGNPATSSSITITVNPNLPVSVSIVSDANGVCPGTTVNFIATPTNGGAAPSYQWKVNGVNNGGNTTVSTFSYKPTDKDVVTCVITSNATPCATGNPATSNSVNMTVTVPLVIGISIVAGANPVCAGTPVTFTVTPTNEGNAPSYQWQVNGGNGTGTTTNSTYTYVPVNGDKITCILTSSISCNTGNPKTSNVITMTVNPLLTVGITITANQNPVCDGTAVTFTATPTNGGANPSYQWQNNGVNIPPNETNSTYKYTPALNNTDKITCIVTSNIAPCPDGNPATSNAIRITVNPILPVSVTISADANPVCDGTSVKFTAIPTNPGTLPTYQWQVDGVNKGMGITFNYAPKNGENITCILSSNAICPSGNPATSNTITMDVRASEPVSITIVADANPVCAGTPVTFTATPTNGGAAPSYQWQVDGANVGANTTNSTYTFTPTNGKKVTCIITSNTLCPTGNPATSNQIVIQVDPLKPVSLNITTSANDICEGTSVTFTANPTNEGTNPTYQWKSSTNSNIGTGKTFTYTPANGEIITCELTSDITPCPRGNPATSNAITMIVNSISPVSISITADANTVCEGTSVKFTATITNGGATPTYVWRVNGVIVQSSTKSDYTYALNNSNDGDIVTCDLISSAKCPSVNTATSTPINMTVNTKQPVTISIVADQNPVCEGTTVIFKATPTNGGPTPKYQWKVGPANVGGNRDTYSYIPKNGDVITCTLTSDITPCPTGNPATSNTITMTVNPNLPVSVLIVADSNPVCEGTIVKFTATNTNGGNAPSYKWLVNGGVTGINTTSSFSYTPLDGDIVTCIITSNATPCATGNPATSNAVTMTVNPNLPVSLIISVDNDTVCDGTQVSFIATSTNGGTNPTYQWKVNNITTVPPNSTSTYKYTPKDGDDVICIVSSNATCPTGSPATSNTIKIKVNPILPVSVTIAASATTVCEGTQVTFTSTPTNGGTDPSYQWRVNNTDSPGETNSTFTYTPVNNDKVTCVLNSNAAPCATGNPATSNTIAITVNKNNPVSVSITANPNPVCETFPVTLTATPVNGGNAPTYEWQVNGAPVGTTNPYSYTPNNGDNVICILTSNINCPTGNPATSNAITITVLPTDSVKIIIAVDKNDICAGDQVVFTATPTNGGTTPTYKWLVKGQPKQTGTDNTYTFIPGNNDVITCILTADNTILCPDKNPVTSKEITMKVNPILPVSILIGASANPVCDGIPVTFTATPTNGGTTPTYQWFVKGIDQNVDNSIFTYSPLDGDDIYCILTSNAAPCATGSPATSNTITMTVNPIQTAGITIVADANPVCAGTSVTYTATPINGGNNPKYQWQVDGSPVGTNSNTFTNIPVDGASITCIMTSDYVCSQGNPATSAPITMTVNPLPPAAITGTSSICKGDNTTLTASGGDNYLWSTTDKTDAINVTPPANITYTVTVTNTVTGCSATASQPVTVKPVPTSDFTLDATVCINSNTHIVYSGTASANATYNWNFDGGTPPNGTVQGPYDVNWNILGNKTITLSVTENGCTSIVTTHSIDVLDLPVPEFSIDKSSGCDILTVQFTDASTNVPNNPTYNWDFGDNTTSAFTSPTHTYTKTGIYSVSLEISGTGSCTSKIVKNSLINLYPGITAKYNANPTVTPLSKPNISFTDQSTGNEPSGFPVSWFWDLGDGSTSSDNTFSYAYKDVGTYEIIFIVNNQYGCSDTVNGEIIITPTPTLFIPNAFTPDKDMNKVFKPVGQQISYFDMLIYDRWGNLIFHSTDMETGWDGTYKNAKAPIGVYTYVIKYKEKYLNTDLEGYLKSKTGLVTLLR